MSDEYIKRVVASDRVERLLNATEEVPDDSDCEVLDKRMDLEEILDDTIPENCFEIDQEIDIMKDEYEAERTTELGDVTQNAYRVHETEGGVIHGAKGNNKEFERY